jgi:catechol 2,3-dioxygenase-like lactoylglutathione lyase family enzyme
VALALTTKASCPPVDRADAREPTKVNDNPRRTTIMKFKSAAGTVCYVKNLERTVEFYERLGFQFKTKEPGRATAYINWWWVDFHQIDAADAPAWHVSPNVDNAEIGALFYFSVESVPQAYDELTTDGLRPSSEPIELRGNREFMIVDPDGYKLVFFKRK